MKLLVTCEHGGNRIPARYWPLFRKHRALLESHRGYDPGALAFAREVASAFGAELVFSTTSRLLVELNRSPRNPKLFSEISSELPADERARILDRYYRPYRDWVESQIRAAVEAKQRVLQLSCHSFTPNLNGVERRADIGLLYDPKRRGESAFCRAWQATLERADPRLAVRRNYPYRGYDDGLTTYLRKLFPDARYRGVELEINQKYPLGEARPWRRLRATLIATLEKVLTD